MVSAAKLRRAQQAIQQMRPYSNKLNGMMSNIMSFSDGLGAEIFGRKRVGENKRIVCINALNMTENAIVNIIDLKALL